MLRKLIIAAAATASLAAISANQASAKVHIDGAINVGIPGVYGSPYPYPVYPSYPSYGGYDDEEDGCGYQIIQKKMWNWNHTKFKVVTKKVWSCY